MEKGWVPKQNWVAIKKNGKKIVTASFQKKKKACGCFVGENNNITAKNR